eukprot:COSAG01_NODE_577_length_15268_cov_31.213462_3_plen_108_part_00
MTAGGRAAAGETRNTDGNKANNFPAPADGEVQQLWSTHGAVGSRGSESEAAGGRQAWLSRPPIQRRAWPSRPRSTRQPASRPVASGPMPACWLGTHALALGPGRLNE